MNDQQSSDAETDQHLQRFASSAGGGEKVVHSKTDCAASRNQTDASKNHSEPSTLRKRATIARRLATGTAIAAIAGLVVNFFTLLAIRGQLEEMRSSSLQVERAIQQSTRLADAAAMSADMAKQSYSAQQRGWISITANPNAPPAANTDFKVNVSAEDVGQSPALHVSTVQEIYIIEGNSFNLDEFRKRPLPIGQLSAFPTQGIASLVSLSKSLLSQDVIDGLNAGKKTIVVLAKAQYSDVGGNLHTTGACFHYDMQGNNFPFCGGGNWAD